jgi:hypothetical protein
VANSLVKFQMIPTMTGTVSVGNALSVSSTVGLRPRRPICGDELAGASCKHDHDTGPGYQSGHLQQCSEPGNNAVSLNAGQILAMNGIGATVTSGSKSVRLSAKAPLTGSALFATDSAGYLPAGEMIFMTANRTEATLRSNAIGTGLTTLTLTTNSASTERNRAVTNAVALTLAVPGSGIQVFDTTPYMDDPNHPGYMVKGAYWDGLHTDDHYHALMAAGFKAMLRPMLYP